MPTVRVLCSLRRRPSSDWKSLYRGGPSKNWLKTKNMVEGEFVLLGTEIVDSGILWALLARKQNGELEFAVAAILGPPSRARAE
jgi:bifunctional non-homologous end joining protein LigD